MLYQRIGRQRVLSRYTEGKVIKKECVNYKGVNILSIPGQIYERVLISRLMERTKSQVVEEQRGFRSGRCIGQIFVLKQLVENYREKRKELHVAFMDLEKVYNKVCREELWRVLHECGVQGYLIRSMSSLYDGSQACVRLVVECGNNLR